MQEITYFELNDWIRGTGYPDEEPFISWIKNDIDIKFRDEDWVKNNQLCVVASFVDMSLNFCVTATTKWVEKNCPSLFTGYKKFLRYPDDNGDVYGQFGDKFMAYKEENIGITWMD